MEPEKKKRKIVSTDDDYTNTNKLCEIRATLIKENPELFNCSPRLFIKELRELYNTYLKSVGKTELTQKQFGHLLETKIAWAPTSKEEYNLFLDKFINILIDYIPIPVNKKNQKDWISLTNKCKEEMKDIPKIDYIKPKFVENKYNIVLNALIPSDKNLKDNEILKGELKKVENKKKIKDKLLNRHKNYCIVNNIVSYEKELEKEENISADKFDNLLNVLEEENISANNLLNISNFREEENISANNLLNISNFREEENISANNLLNISNIEERKDFENFLTLIEGDFKCNEDDFKCNEDDFKCNEEFELDGNSKKRRKSIRKSIRKSNKNLTKKHSKKRSKNLTKKHSKKRSKNLTKKHSKKRSKKRSKKL